MTDAIPDVDQLEQNFSATIQVMLAELSDGWNEADLAELRNLWQQMEHQLALLSDADQLRLAGNIILHLSELCYLRAKRWLTDWETQHDQTDPLWDDNILAGLVQRTMYLDLSDLIRAKAKPLRSKPPSGSIAAAIDKKKLLNALNTIEAQEAAKQTALAVAHDEDVSAWITAIDQWLNDKAVTSPPQAIWFSELCRDLCQVNSRMTPVKIFLSLLLGGYYLEQPGGFYESDILVKCNSSQEEARSDFQSSES